MAARLGLVAVLVLAGATNGYAEEGSSRFRGRVMPAVPPPAPDYNAFGTVECYTATTRRIVAKNAFTTIATRQDSSGLAWFESPVVMPSNGNDSSYLLFSDVRGNRILKWDSHSRVSSYLEGAGCYADKAYCDSLASRFAFYGANGLAREPGTGLLVMTEQGDRRVTRLNADGTKTILAQSYRGKRLNSPNDIAYHPITGDIYFTDPSFGLPNMDKDALKEVPFNGVYRIPAASIEGLTPHDNGSTAVELIHDGFITPNGIAFSPDAKRLYVSDTYSGKAWWYVMDVKDDGTVQAPRLLSSASDMAPGTEMGISDSVKVDAVTGHLFAGGTTGVSILSPQGVQVGFIHTTGRFAAGIGFGDEQEGHLYIAGSDYVVQLPLEVARACIRGGEQAVTAPSQTYSG